MLDSVAPLLMDHAAIEAAQSATGFERAVAGAAMTLFISIVVLGFLQSYGNQAVATCRRSPIITVCFGLPGILVVGLLTWVGLLISDISIGVFFSVLLIAFGAAVFPTAVVIGLVSIGQSIAARVGRDRLWVGVLVGSLIAGLAAFSIPIGIAVGTIAAAFGMGASIRIFFGASGTSRSDERTVPPANKI